MRVLTIEDDHATSQSMELMMKSEGFNVYVTDLGEEGVDLAKIYEYDLITLDLNLPDMNGLDVLRQIRAAKVTTPIIIISGTSSVEKKVQGLRDGADDFMGKPFHKDELIARAHALIRRSKGHASATITVGAITLDLDGKTVKVLEDRVHLTGREYQMLELLMLRRGTTLTKENFLNHLYGGMDEPELKIIDVFICKLRKKLVDVGAGNHIETVWGRGYRIVDEPVAKGQVALVSSNHNGLDSARKLRTVRGQALAVLAEHDQPLLVGTVALKLGHENAAASGIYTCLSVARRDRLVESAGARGNVRYNLTPEGRAWLDRNGWKPAAAVA